VQSGPIGGGCGGVGIQIALEHPEVLRRLVLMNTVTGFGQLAPRLVIPFLALMAGNRWLLKKMLRSGFTRPPPDKTMQLLLDDALLVSKQTCAEWFHRNNRMRHLDRLHDVAVPTLVMIGGKDTVLPLDRQHKLADTLTNGEKSVLEDAGHMMALEIPQDVFAAMSAFLERGS
jgi:pimeloyl-ACP methyl ester carboxylesterase